MTDLITRDQKLTESVEIYAKAKLTARGYPDLDWRESYPYDLTGPLEQTLIAAGFDFDDPGRQAECGSDLIERVYTIQFWTFGRTNTEARNVAHALKFALEHDGTIPLLDISDPSRPVIDSLVVDGVSADRQIIPDPEPWQEFTWMTTIRVTDTYFTTLV